MTILRRIQIPNLFFMTTAQNQSRFFRISFIAVSAYGVFLRLFHYFSNRSLYTDEAYLANNLLVRNFRQLTQPLEANQHAPLLFLWLEKLAMNLFGTHEFALRLFPLIAGLASLLLFFQLLKNLHLTATVELACLLIFATGFPLVYYSSEVKQYSFEVLCTILAYALYFLCRDETSKTRKLLAYALAGVLMVWFSYPVIFVLFSISATHLFVLLRNKRQPLFLTFAAIYTLWGISFALNYFLVILPNSLNSSAIVDTWVTEFAPLPQSVSEVKWYGLMIFNLFDYPLNLNWIFLKPWLGAGFRFSFIGLLFMAWGGYFLAKSNRPHLFLFALPIVLTLLASGMQRYPFTERFLLFLVPNFLILIGFGANELVKFMSGRLKIIAMAGIVLLILPPLLTSVKDLVREEQFGGWKRREMKKAIVCLMEQRKPDEIIFKNGIASSFDYYNRIYNLNWPSETISQNTGSFTALQNAQFNSHVATASGGRAFWVMVAGDRDDGSYPNHKTVFLDYFNQNFHQLYQYEAKGILVSRYRLK